jgi:hypothetical protein
MQSEKKTLRSPASTTIFRGRELLTLFIVYGVQMGIQSILAWFGNDQRIEINAFVAGMIALSVVFSSYCSKRSQPSAPFPKASTRPAMRSAASCRTMRLIIAATDPHRHPASEPLDEPPEGHGARLGHRLTSCARPARREGRQGAVLLLSAASPSSFLPSSVDRHQCD